MKYRTKREHLRIEGRCKCWVDQKKPTVPIDFSMAAAGEREHQQDRRNLRRLIVKRLKTFATADKTEHSDRGALERPARRIRPPEPSATPRSKHEPRRVPDKGATRLQGPPKPA